MAAYSAVVSLKNTIYGLIHSNPNCISFVSYSKDILHTAYDYLKFLQDVLEKLEGECTSWSSPSETAKALEGEMGEAVWKLEDKLESLISTQILSQSESDYSIDLQDLSQDVECFSKKAKKIMVEYTKEFANPFLEDDEDDEEDEEEEEAVFSSTTYLGGNMSKMVGFTDMFGDIRDMLIHDRVHISIVGMAGIGKTTLAKNILEDPSIVENFESRIFVTVGQPSVSTYSKVKKILRAIIAKVNRCTDKKLVDKKYLIVFDDVWDLDFLPAFFEGLRYSSDGCQVLVTTRQRRVGRFLSKRGGGCNMRFMNKEESWDLLRGKVFADKACPPELEKIGKKIAENCEGLPLLIITVADLLLEFMKTPEDWNRVAEDKQNSVFVEAYDQILEVLYPSYYWLDQYSKACFLYMAVFPQNYEVHYSRLFNLWSAEYLIAPNRSPEDCLQHLDHNTVVVLKPEGIRRKSRVWSLHSVFWHLCRSEASKNLLLHTLNRHVDGFAENIKRQRRLSVYKNVLFGIKDVYNSVASVSNARSLLCTGAYHPYHVQICYDSLRLLRVLDALTIRFYEFPVEVLELVLLRYLALTLDRNLSSSISKLWNLQYLIVHQHMSIKYTLAESYLPQEIWDLRELKHLQIIGRNLPEPAHYYDLDKLLTLLDVGPHSCTSRVLQLIPRLEKLRVRIELTPDADQPLTRFYPNFHICEPKSLQIIIVNPEIAAPTPSLPVFRSHLRKLTLSGFGHPWTELNKIAELPLLEVLKLQCYAFRGEKWETVENGFKTLEYLLIEDSDLVKWTCPWRRNDFENLGCLTMKSCYKLQEFPVFKLVELVDCNSSAVAYAKDKTLELGYELHVDSSWDD